MLPLRLQPVASDSNQEESMDSKRAARQDSWEPTNLQEFEDEDDDLPSRCFGKAGEDDPKAHPLGLSRWNFRAQNVLIR